MAACTQFCNNQFIITRVFFFKYYQHLQQECVKIMN